MMFKSSSDLYKTTHRFSVVIPMYNAELFIHKTLTSVCEQTFDEWDLIVVDNCSSDKGCDVVFDFCKKEPRIQLIRNVFNSGGPAQPRNMGIQAARGEYIAFLDADDLWYIDKLKDVDNALKENPNVDVLYHSEVKVSGKKRTIMRYGHVGERPYHSLLVEGNRLSPSATVVRRMLLIQANGFSEETEMNTVEDYDLWLRLAYKGALFRYINKPLGEFIRLESSLSFQEKRRIQNTFAVNKYHIGVWGEKYLVNIKLIEELLFCKRLRCLLGECLLCIENRKIFLFFVAFKQVIDLILSSRKAIFFLCLSRKRMGSYFAV